MTASLDAWSYERYLSFVEADGTRSGGGVLFFMTGYMEGFGWLRGICSVLVFGLTFLYHKLLYERRLA